MVIVTKMVWGHSGDSIRLCVTCSEWQRSRKAEGTVRASGGGTFLVEEEGYLSFVYQFEPV